MSHKKYPPGPVNWNAPLGLTWRHVFRLWRNPLGFIDDLQKYGDIAFFRMFGIRAYVANHPDPIRDVLLTKRDSFRKLPRDVRAVRQLLGNGLIVSEGDFWLRQRRLLQPAFHACRMAGYGAVSVEETHRMLARWRGQSEVRMAEEMTDLTMRVAARTLLGVQLDAESRDLVRAARILSHAFIQEIHAIFSLPDWLPLPHKRRKCWAIETFDRLICRIIAQRRRSGEDKGDLLSMLLLAVDHEGDGTGMTDQQVRDEAMTLFTAAFHANSMALAWTWYLLAQHSDIAARVLSEVTEVLGDRVATNEDLPQLIYTQMVLKESLRLYPPAWGLFCRQAVKDVELAGYQVRAGSWVFLFPYLTHRCERFFPEPEKFDPERFSPDREKEIEPYSYFPFGAGPRVCIGNTFAMTEMTLILATIIQQFEITLPPHEEQVGMEAALAIRPRGGLRVHIAPRMAACD